jgi:hypothetical protein
MGYRGSRSVVYRFKEIVKMEKEVRGGGLLKQTQYSLGDTEEIFEISENIYPP